MSGDVREMPVEEWNARRERARQNPPTSDDVWVTADGRRLDTPEKHIAFLRDYNAMCEREALTDDTPKRPAA